MWPFSKKKDVRENLQQNARAIASGPDRTVRPVRDRTRAEIAREEWQEREEERQRLEDEREWAEIEAERREADAWRKENSYYLQKCFDLGINPLIGNDPRPKPDESMESFYYRMLRQKEYEDWLRNA